MLREQKRNLTKCIRHLENRNNRTKQNRETHQITQQQQTKRRIHRTVQAHSAKADQNPFVLRTPGILENVPERRAKPNCL